ncbi:unnamed protein product [Oncorhynchus mykiss]|uniref:HECT domain-containing protein n=1 Tax=Oncorhynchus mykiss TaxID=8022 RepID=A0A060XTL1_ONCMY|nr:unnamed protein product [Oncorhynchus mykiss]
MRGFQRACFNPEAKIDTFLGMLMEKGQLMRVVPQDFPRLLMSAIHSSAIFEGPDWEKCLSCNSQTRYDGVYKQVGHMTAVCLVHGGVEPHFVREALQCGLQPPVPELKEILEYDFREKLEKVSDFIL